MKSIGSALLVAMSLGAVAQDDYKFKKDVVIPIRIEDEISVKGSHEGDRFRATVSKEDQDLPMGTKLIGQVKRIGERDGRAFVELGFDEAQLPAGRRIKIEAVPIQWDERNFRQEKNGRFTAKKGFGKKDDAVLAGLLGGLVVGAIVKKPFEGAFAGAIAGIIVAEAGAHAENNLVISAGSAMGALFLKGVDTRTDLWKEDEGNRPTRGWPGQGESSKGGELRYDGKVLKIGDAERPYREDGEWMVPLWAVADQTGVEIDQTGSLYFVSTDAGILRMEQGHDDYRLNGKRGSFRTKVVKMDRVVYVPLEAFRLLGRDRLEIAN